ncbi:unnamed protein product [Toxocara canis]|uniref:Uncharacterized protein n=1 Tax=Toxocara canis TaxID=6265 RepID=A0A183U273_TOXCA|nr:unnamed protein product [Toxocara canis]
MTPCGVILLILDCFVRISMPNKLISQNVVQFDPFADSTISSANRQSDVTFNSTIASSSPSDEIGRRLKRHYRYNNFINSFVYQRIHGNHIPQCPCVINPGSNKCIAYDSRYQAASVEEAIVSFPDFTSESIYPAVPIDENTFLCRTLECQACARLMIDRLKKIGFLAWNAQLALNIPYGIDTRYCRRLRFSRPHRTFNPPSTISAAMRAVIREGKRRSGLLDGGDTPQQSQRGSFDPFATGTESHGSGGPFYQVGFAKPITI